MPTADGSVAAPESGRRIDGVDAAAILLMAAGVLGIALHGVVRNLGLAIPAPERYNVFYYLYERAEKPFLLLVAGFGILALFAPRRRRPKTSTRVQVPFTAFVVVAALLVVVVARLGERYVMHDYSLSMDEYAAEFQSEIFASGHFSAPMPKDWRPFSWPLCPVFVDYDPVTHRWQQVYLPVYAVARALFVAIGAGLWTNAVFAGLSIVLVGAIGRRFWPGEERPGRLAVLFLALSSQFLLTSMTGYSYPAHLFLNLLWLWLYARDDAAGWKWLPWVGVAALGLHNPFVHALFVAPFLISIAFSRPRLRAAYVFLVYAFGTAGWYAWTLAQPLAPGQGALGGVFGLPGRTQWLFQGMNLSLVFSWQPPVVGLLALIAVLSWRRLSPSLRLLAWGTAASFAFYFVFRMDQQHGWGYRFIYGVLGNIALLAVAGARDAESESGRNVSPLLAAGLAAALLFQIPLRLRESESFVAPFARAFRALEGGPAGVVGLDVREFWYAQDLVRNDPFLETRPVFVHLDRFSVAERAAFLRRFGKVRVMTSADARRFGIPSP